MPLYKEPKEEVVEILEQLARIPWPYQLDQGSRGE